MYCIHVDATKEAAHFSKGKVIVTFCQVENDDEMGMMVAQINTWNFDMFKFSTISKDHPLVSMAYIILQSVSLKL